MFLGCLSFEISTLHVALTASSGRSHRVPRKSQINLSLFFSEVSHIGQNQLVENKLEIMKEITVVNSMKCTDKSLKSLNHCPFCATAKKSVQICDSTRFPSEKKKFYAFSFKNLNTVTQLSRGHFTLSSHCVLFSMVISSCSSLCADSSWYSGPSF